VSSNRKFWLTALVVVVLSATLLALSWSQVTTGRHQLAHWLEGQGSGKSGPVQLAWYELAHAATVNDPTIGLALAQAQNSQGAVGGAEATLSAYPSYPPAAVLRAQLLIRQHRYAEAAQVLQPVTGQSPQVAYWQAVALAEQGKLTDAIAALQGSTDPSNLLLGQLLQLVAGKPVNTALSAPEAAKTLAFAQQSNTALALSLYRLGLLSTSERVLAGIASPSVVDWQLRATIALAQPTPDRAVAEQAYWQALLLEPTNSSLRANVLVLATELKDQSMVNQVNTLVDQLPTR